MSAKPTLIYRDVEIACFLAEDLAVYRDVGSAPPATACWQQYVQALERFVPRIACSLVLPRAAGLTARQREEIRRLIGGRPTAVLTGSVINRCIITSLSWFQIPIQAFGPHAYGDALRWLDREPLLPLVLQGLELYPPSQTRPAAMGRHDRDAPYL